MKRTYIFQIGQRHDHYFVRARAAALSVGASFVGDPHQGRFSHRGVHGTYLVEDGLVTVALIKPIGVPWGPIERGLERLFEQAQQPVTSDSKKRSVTETNTERHNHEPRTQL